MITPTQRASIFAQLGDTAEAVRWLEKSLADPAGGSTARQFSRSPWIAPLRGSVAFEKLLHEHPQ